VSAGIFLEMNIKQQKYKKYRLEGMSAYKAARKAGYAHATAWNAHKNIEKRCSFDELLAQAGMDNDTVFKVMGEGLNATKSFVVNNVNEDGEIEKEVVESADYQTRHKYLETLLKLRGKLKETTTDGQEMQVIVIKSGEKKPEIDRKINVSTGGRVLIDT